MHTAHCHQVVLKGECLGTGLPLYACVMALSKTPFVQEEHHSGNKPMLPMPAAARLLPLCSSLAVWDTSPLPSVTTGAKKILQRFKSNERCSKRQSPVKGTNKHKFIVRMTCQRPTPVLLSQVGSILKEKFVTASGKVPILPSFTQVAFSPKLLSHAKQGSPKLLHGGHLKDQPYWDRRWVWNVTFACSLRCSELL